MFGFKNIKNVPMKLQHQPLRQVKMYLPMFLSPRSFPLEYAFTCGISLRQ